MGEVHCLECLRKKERIDELERYFLMWEQWIKSLRADITELVHMKDKISYMIGEIKKEWDKEWMKELLSDD